MAPSWGLGGFLGVQPAVLAGLLVWPLALAAQAPPTRVQFDAPYLLAVSEVQNATGVQPGEKLVECRVDVSALVTAGNEREVTQFVFQVQSLGRTMQVHDYLPRSARDTNITSPVTISEDVENSSNAGLNWTARYQDITTLSGNIGETQRESGSRKFERLPALETVVASGTIYRGTGVYFKLHTTDRQLLEGSTCLSILWRVPAGWRADYIHLHCVAEGRARGNSPLRVGQRDFLIPVHVAGDLDGKLAAAEFARSEANLRMAAREQLQQLTNRPPSPWPPRVNIFTTADREPMLPHDWLERLLYLPSNPQVPAGLNAETREAASDFLAARQRLRQLSGWAMPATDQMSAR